MDINRALSFASGLLGGAIVGAGVVLLLAPQSGADTRQSITDKFNEIIGAGREAMDERRQQLRAEYAAGIQIPMPEASTPAPEAD